MPPKRTNNKASVTPVRQAPTRQAKTRSEASTRSMYKDSDAYNDPESEEISDHISEPEDLDNEEGATSGPARRRSGRVQGSATSRSSTRNKSATSKSAPAEEKGKGRAQKTSSRSAADTSATTKQTPPPTRTRTTQKHTTGVTAPTEPPTSARPKRKLGSIRFSSMGPSPASSSSSRSTPISASTSHSDQLEEQKRREDQWTEKYAPSDIDDVAVHKLKIRDVREWLQIYTDLTHPKHPPRDSPGGSLLVLTGPAGSGKTTVIQMLAKELGLHIVEWVNSVNENSLIQRPTIPGEDRWKSTSLDEEYIPVMNAFQEFFSRASRFNPMLTTRDVPSQTSGVSTSLSGTGKKNIILIEDLPPVSAYSSRKVFQDTITRFVNSRTNTSSVLVIIVSDVFSKQSTELLFSSTGESRDTALTIRTLLPPTILDRIDSSVRGCSRIKQIKFNPIAMTIMKKAIRNLISQEFTARSEYAPDAVEIEQLIEIHDGDIRAVINALQFLCHVPAKRRRRYREAAMRLEEEREGFEDAENIMSQGQDSSLGIFHAVAKVLYNRRDWAASPVQFDNDIVKIPSQDWHKQRPPLRFNPEKDLIEKLPVDPDLFTLMLHQNYTRHMNTIDECLTAIEYLCLADQMSGSPGGHGSTSNYAQMVQLQPYVSSLSVRGLLFAPRTAGPSNFSSGGGQKKHWWPELFAVNRTMRSNDQMYTDVAADLAGEEAQGLSAGHITGPGFFPKAVIREELVPMLHKCATMNPYMPIFYKSLRSSSKDFVRTVAGNYVKKFGVVKKEFGEGDEGFMEEVVSSESITSSVDEVIDDVNWSGSGAASSVAAGPGLRGGVGIGTGFGSDSWSKLQQQKQQFNPLTYEIEQDEDPIEDFSDSD
ncbi:Cell cycle checkpoint protein rad17 [Haplosporangium sp. Z 767]|nr:Cell cycle checkpoint protein rad17 [Haplosporangium sp. Z 767]